MQFHPRVYITLWSKDTNWIVQTVISIIWLIMHPCPSAPPGPDIQPFTEHTGGQCGHHHARQLASLINNVVSLLQLLYQWLCWIQSTSTDVQQIRLRYQLDYEKIWLSCYAMHNVCYHIPSKLHCQHLQSWLSGSLWSLCTPVLLLAGHKECQSLLREGREGGGCHGYPVDAFHWPLTVEPISKVWQTGRIIFEAGWERGEGGGGAGGSIPQW